MSYKIKILENSLKKFLVRDTLFHSLRKLLFLALFVVFGFSSKEYTVLIFFSYNGDCSFFSFCP